MDINESPLDADEAGEIGSRAAKIAMQVREDLEDGSLSPLEVMHLVQSLISLLAAAYKDIKD